MAVQVREEVVYVHQTQQRNQFSPDPEPTDWGKVLVRLLIAAWIIAIIALGVMGKIAVAAAVVGLGLAVWLIPEIIKAYLIHRRFERERQEWDERLRPMPQAAPKRQDPPEDPPSRISRAYPGGGNFWWYALGILLILSGLFVLFKFHLIWISAIMLVGGALALWFPRK